MAFCNNCGMEITEETVFCPKCGVPVASQPVQNNNGEAAQSQNFQQPQPQYYQPQQTQQQYYQPQQPQQQYYQQPQQQYYQPQQSYQQPYQQQGYNIDTTGVLVWSIINILFCWPLSVYSIVTLNKVNKAVTREEGERQLNSIKIVNGVATGVGILFLLIALSL